MIELRFGQRLRRQQVPTALVLRGALDECRVRDGQIRPRLGAVELDEHGPARHTLAIAETNGCDEVRALRSDHHSLVGGRRAERLQFTGDRLLTNALAHDRDRHAATGPCPGAARAGRTTATIAHRGAAGSTSARPTRSRPTHPGRPHAGGAAGRMTRGVHGPACAQHGDDDGNEGGSIERFSHFPSIARGPEGPTLLRYLSRGAASWR